MTTIKKETYTDEILKEIATDILNQLRSNITEFWAWGSKNPTCFEKEINGIPMATLRFKIRTPKVPVGGYVQISLDEGKDEYVVEAIKVTSDNQIESLGVVDGVHFTDLHSTINSLIEDKETYTHFFF